MSDTRIDKFLWSVRVFKTRAISAEACKKGKIEVNEKKVKASYVVKVGDKIAVHKMPVIYSYKVIDITGKRVGAKLVENFVINTTPQTELDKLEMQKLGLNFYRKKGEGRPTKKDRRELDQIW
jgi:ribosome-associated heat shock protein Hsp15